MFEIDPALIVVAQLELLCETVGLATIHFRVRISILISIHVPYAFC